jgi:hypothetical protein
MRFVIPEDALPFDILTAINEWSLLTSTTNSTILWRILTALRGPDSGDGPLKSQTTLVIRRAVLPSTAQYGGALVSAMPADVHALRKIHQLGAAFLKETPGDHFHWHVMVAARAILSETGQPVEPVAL